MLVTSAPTDRSNIYTSLDGLRGIAVLYVLLSHLGNSGLFLLPVSHNAIGKVGVWLFFALSAFLLTTHLLADLTRTRAYVQEIVTFGVRRIFRIYPLYCFALAVHYLWGDLALKEVADHLCLLAGKAELWAIPVEFKYYALLPIVCVSCLWFGVKVVRLSLGILALASIGYSIGSPEAVFSNQLSPLPRLLPFLAGSFLALIVGGSSQARHLSRVKSGALCLVVSGALLGCTIVYRQLSMQHYEPEISPWLSCALSLTAAGLIYCAVVPSVLRSILSVGPLVLLGRISFSIYLLHMFVIQGVATITGVPGPVKAWLCVALTGAGSLIAHRLIEVNGIRLGRRVLQRLFA